MTAKRWMCFGALVFLSNASCSESAEPGDDAGASGTAGSAQAGSMAGRGTAGTSGSMSSGGTAGTQSGAGRGGSGGSAPIGGTGGTSGTGGTGGAAAGGAAAGGAGGMAGSAGTGGTGSSECASISASAPSPAIQTVGVIEWTTGVTGMTAARIEFGRDTTYGMTAPVTPADGPNFRTLLLGMKRDDTYHYRIVVTGPDGDCTGPDQTIMTGPLPNGLPAITVDTRNPAGIYGGFLLAGRFSTMGGMGVAYILDADGDYVWVHPVMKDVTGARMSYDGKYMWINSANVPDSGANVHRVSMDGMTDEDLSDKFVGQNHQLTILPDETVAFYAYGDGCDDIKEYSPSTGMVKTVVSSSVHGAGAPCHVNAIDYEKEGGGAYLFSDLQNDNITKVTRTGEVVWVLGGSTADFTGTGSTWSRQHGIDSLGPNGLVFFNNSGEGGGSTIIEMALDLTGMTASRSWTYTAMPSIANDIMGDVQRLENGNTLAAYSTKGTVHEVSQSGELLQVISWNSGGQFGYVEKRKTLYGPPQR